MKVFHLPEEIKALIFDMDLTLYTNTEYAQYQIDVLIKRLAEIRSQSFDTLKSEIDATMEAWKRSHEGKPPSFSKILNNYGINTEEIALWRNELLEPERFVEKDIRLNETLKELSEVFYLALITNNPVLVALKTLAALGVEKYFPVIIGLDTCMVSKPHEKPYLKFFELSSIPCETCVSIGDRFEVDLEIPLKMGMGGILVSGVKDVYELPGILLKGDKYGV